MAEENEVVDDDTSVDTSATTTEVVPDTEAPIDTTQTGGESAKSLADAINAGIESQSAKQPGDKPAGEADGKKGEGAADGDEKDGETDEEKAAREAKEAEGKKPDHVNDPIPAQVSERTRERITSLVGTVKELEGTVKSQGELIQTIQDTGATAEQFSHMIGFMRDFNANDIESVERAYETMKETMVALSIRLGRALPEVNLLEKFPDLATEVKHGQITAARAHEIAISRIRGDHQAASVKKTSDQATEAKQYETDKAAAITTLNDLGKELAARDGATYDAKFKEIIPALQEEFKKIPPSQWEAAFHRAYNMSKAKPPVAAPVVVTPAAPAKKQPIRPVTPAGGGGGAAVAAPKSIAEAISAGIDAASAH